MSPEDLKAFIGIAGAPLVVALVELVKWVIPGIPARFWPTIALLWAVALNFFIAWRLATDFYLAGFAGIVTALVAMKFYDAGPTSKGQVN